MWVDGCNFIFLETFLADYSAVLQISNKGLKLMLNEDTKGLIGFQGKRNKGHSQMAGKDIAYLVLICSLSIEDFSPSTFQEC